MIKLRNTASTWVVTSPGGWEFKIETFHEEREGWTARAWSRSTGVTSERGAINHLREPLRALLRELDEEFNGEVLPRTGKIGSDT